MPDAPRDAAQDAVVSYIQGTTSAAASSVIVLTLPMAVVSGDSCIVSVAIQSGTVATVTNSGGDTFTLVGTNGNQSVYIAANMHAERECNGDDRARRINRLHRRSRAVPRARTTSPVDGSSSTAGNGNALDSGATTTAHPHDLLVGLAASSGSLSAGTGYTMRVGPTYSLIEDQEVTSAGSYHATATATANPMWTMRIVALKAAD